MIIKKRENSENFLFQKKPLEAWYVNSRQPQCNEVFVYILADNFVISKDTVLAGEAMFERFRKGTAHRKKLVSSYPAFETCLTFTKKRQ